MSHVLALRALLHGALLGVVLAFIGAPARAEAGAPITVFAAASMTDVLNALAAEYKTKTGHNVRFSFAASSTLARQLEAGAPADMFVSADTDWIDYVANRNLIDASTRRNLIGNRLVLIATTGSTVQLKIAPGMALAAALGPGGRLAMADPESVPAGRYGRTALITLGVWGQVADRLVRAENVRGAMTFVARGEAPLGIVYQSDAKADTKVRVVDM
jgi:molybdate transport system substrate-binding protein